MQTLTSAELLKRYTIADINTDDEEIKRFLFTLGCYRGEEITVISVLSGTYVVAIKDGRYSIDEELASTILV